LDKAMSNLLAVKELEKIPDSIGMPLYYRELV